MSYASNTMPNSPPAPVRESTAIEQHLHELFKLNENLSAALARAERSCDRLIGQEPATLGKADSVKDAAEPPLMRRLEIALMQAHSLSEGIHRQLERFERL